MALSAVAAELDAAAKKASMSVVVEATIDGDRIIGLAIDTTQFERVVGGLPIEPDETIFVVVGSEFPSFPPSVGVDHDRWAGYPHVLAGTRHAPDGNRLCLFLDPSNQWDPRRGMAAFVERLWDWLADAVAGRFDPKTALYHPVGGVIHRDPDTPTVVVNEPLDSANEGFAIRRIWLNQRTPTRLDLLPNDALRPDGAFSGVLVTLSGPLYRGGGRHISDLALSVRGQDSRTARRTLTSRLEKEAARTASRHLYVVVAVPNIHLTGEARHHLIACRLPTDEVSSACAAAAFGTETRSESEPRLEWLSVDDCRAALTTRRDEPRPQRWFYGRTIEVWGCGALGSWVAEQLARAGCRNLILRDPGQVTRGLLVRQNFTECDVGCMKVDALAVRVAAIADGIGVDPIARSVLSTLPQLDDVDLVVDCTASTAVAATIDDHQRSGQLEASVVQMATDLSTASLGIVTIATKSDPTNEVLDARLREAASMRADLAPFRDFWNQGIVAPITPTLGCSAPTFAGASGDAMGIASAALAAAGHALTRNHSCGYLLATPAAPFNVPSRTSVVSEDSEPTAAL